MMKVIATMAAGLLLAACAAKTDDYAQVIADSVPPDAALKAQIVAGARTILYDPSSVRHAEISNVASFRDGLQGVCVRAESKDVKGDYLGLHSMGIAMRDGKMLDGTLDHPICDRADVPWQPFPELNALGGR